MKASKFMGERKAVEQAFKLHTMTNFEVLQRFVEPCVLRSEAHDIGIPCSYEVAFAIMEAAGWIAPADLASSSNYHWKAKAKPDYVKGEPVPISKHFCPPAGSTISRTYRDVEHRAVVLTSGKLRDVATNEVMTGSDWVRKVLDKKNSESFIPSVFWGSAKVIES